MASSILHKHELVHLIFLMIFIGIGGFIGLDSFELFEFWKKDLNELLLPIILLLISYLILNALNTSQVVAIKGNQIMKGIYCMPIGFLKIDEKINISDIKEIRLKTNEKLFYEIIIESNSRKLLLIKSIANKIPAEKELYRIKTKINTFANNV